ncbi:MAG: ATP-binding protein, partial [Bacteroidota bacterium]
MKYLVFLLAIIFVVSCGTETEDQPPSSEGSSTPTLKQVWETDTLLRTPESVLFDPEREVIYVANVNMNPWEKDGN